MKKIILSFFFLIVFFGGNAQNPDSMIVLNPGEGVLNIGKEIYILEDKEASLSIEDIQKPEYQALFKKSQEAIPNYNFTSSKIWVKFTVANHTGKEIFLEFAPAIAWYIDFYKPDSLGNPVLTTQTGMMRPLHQREIDNNLFLFALSSKPSPQTYYFSIHSETVVNLPVVLGTIDSILEMRYPYIFLLGIFSGMLLIMFFYNLFIFFSIRDRVYLYYCGYLLSALFVFNYLSGNYGYKWNIVSYFPNYLVVFIFFVNLPTTFFLLKLLQVKKHQWYYRLLLASVILQFIFAMMNLLSGSHRHILSYAQLIILVVYVYTFFYSLVFYLKGNKTARFVVYGFSFIIIGIVIYSLKNMGLLPTNFFTINILVIGTSLEVLLFSLALGDRINSMRREKEASQNALLAQTKENERLVKEQNLILKQKVEEKTKKVQSQYEELQTSQEELQQNFEELQMIQEQLHSTLAHNEAITTALDNSAIVSITDLKGNITKANSLFCEISGYSEQELIGQNHSIVNSGWHDKSFWIEMWKTVSKGTAWRAEVCNQAKNGELYWVDTVINPIYDAKGQIYQYLSIRNVITGRKKAEIRIEQQTKELQETLEQMIDLRLKSEESRLTAENLLKHITDSISYAKRIQDAIIPKESELQRHFDCFVIFKPKDIVSGDFYWFAEKDNCKILALADCTGHGVSGAFMTMIGNNILNQIVHDYEIHEPDQILNKMQSLLQKTLSQSDGKVADGMDIAIIKIEDESIAYAGAMNPIYYTENHELKLIKADKKPIGGESSNHFSYRKHCLKSSQKTFYLLSDGFQDQFGMVENKKFMVKKLKDLLFEISEKPLAEQKQILERRFENWKGNAEQTDDVCLIGIRIP